MRLGSHTSHLAAVTHCGDAGEVDELEVIKGSLRDAIVEVCHDIPWSVADSDHDDAQRDMAEWERDDNVIERVL